jgi:hypothetical protein
MNNNNTTPPPTPADLWNTLGDLAYAAKWQGPKSEAVKGVVKAANDLLGPSRDWAIPCQPTAFDAGDGWSIYRMHDGWHYTRYDVPFLLRSEPHPTPRAAWDTLQQHRERQGDV